MKGRWKFVSIYVDKDNEALDNLVFDWGYDDIGLEDMRHPNRDDRDVESTEPYH